MLIDVCLQWAKTLLAGSRGPT